MSNCCRKGSTGPRGGRGAPGPAGPTGPAGPAGIGGQVIPYASSFAGVPAAEANTVAYLVFGDEGTDPTRFSFVGPRDGTIANLQIDVTANTFDAPTTIDIYEVLGCGTPVIYAVGMAITVPAATIGCFTQDNPAITFLAVTGSRFALGVSSASIGGNLAFTAGVEYQ